MDSPDTPPESGVTTDQATPEGIDADRVTGWFADNVEGVVLPLHFSLIAGGRSNPTYRVQDAAGQAFALRRPPFSHVLPTAHDMSREYRVITALGPTDVPVPVTYGLCTDEAVNGAPFYVMEFVDGHILRTPREAERDFDEPTRRQAGLGLVETLAQLHAVDVEKVGLADLSRHEGYIARQLKRWTEQYRQAQVEGVDHRAAVERVGEALAAQIPAQQGTSIVHGDYRLDNTVLDDGGHVRAILDWEICTLGDPLADLGTLMCYWTDPDDEVVALLEGGAVTAPGFPRRAELAVRYGEVSGRDVSNVNYYVAFACWRLACILQGVYARYLAGAGSGDTNSVEEYPTQVGRLAELAADRLAGS
jgi:aminoglycoside phosphotransferase (APT) family kinase protein